MTAPEKPGMKQASKKGFAHGKVDPSVGKATQFKPGESGNPAGLPKGTKHINTWIQELMEDEKFEARLLDLKEGFVDYKGAPIKAIVKATANDALAHNDPKVRAAARDWLAKYGWPTKNESDVNLKGDLIVQLVNYTDDAGASTPQL